MRTRSVARYEADFGIAEHFLVADSQCLDPALLAAGEGNEEAQLHQLWFGEMLMELCPQGLTGDLCVPQNRARVTERSLLPLGVPV